MIKNNENYIVENKEDLKDPFICYCVMMRFMEEAGEDYVDYNDLIIEPISFIAWMSKEGYITNEQADKLFCVKYIQDVICGGEILFPNTYGQGAFSEYKCYQLLAEFMSYSERSRQMLYDSVNNKANYFDNGEFYKDENGISLACIIPESEFKIGLHDTSDFRNKTQREIFDWTFAEMYHKVKDLTIEESDIELEY